MPDKIKLLQGDITKIQVDAIVNAANSSLLGEVRMVCFDSENYTVYKDLLKQ